MKLSIRKAVTAVAPYAVVCAGLVAMYGAGVRDGESAPVDLSVVYEESGEPYSITVERDGESVRVERVAETWRGNNAADDGLYHLDPATVSHDDLEES